MHFVSFSFIHFVTVAVVQLFAYLLAYQPNETAEVSEMLALNNFKILFITSEYFDISFHPGRDLLKIADFVNIIIVLFRP